MNYLSIDYLIVYAFLGITALVGLGGLRMSVASGSFREYATANKRFGTGALTMTLIATFAGGGLLLKYTHQAYDYGLGMIVAEALMVSCNLLFILYFIAPKIIHFRDCMTVGDLMKVFYGENARMMMGFLALYFCACLVLLQFLSLKGLYEVMGLNQSWGLATGALILAIYTVRGGMRAVTATDILHFIVFIGIIPLLAHLMLNQAGGLRAILSSLSAEQLDLIPPQVKTGNFAVKLVELLIVAPPVYSLAFPFIQRLLMANHQQQSIGMYRGATVILLALIILLGLIGLAGIVVYPGLGFSNVFLHATSQLPPVAKGLMWTAVLGVVISTADSFLHTAGIAFVHDTLKPLASRSGIKFDELRAVRYVTLGTALFSLLICLFYKNAMGFYIYGGLLSGIFFLVPMVAGIMGLKTDKRVFYVSTVITLLVCVSLKTFIQGNIANDITVAGGLLASIVSYLGAHYYYNRGFEVINRNQYGQTTTVWHPSWQGAKKSIASLIPTPQKVVRYFQQSVAENSFSTTTLALFVAISYMVPLFMHSIGQPDAYNWLLVLRMGGALLCVGLLLQSMWPQSMLPYFSAYYHLTLLYCFPFMTTFLFFLEGGSVEWVMNVMLSVMLLTMLLDYATAVGLSIAGIALAIGLYKVGIGPVILSMDRDIAYMLVYGAGFSIIIGVLFSRLRERLLKQANRRLVNQELALEAHFPAVMAESERRTRAFQQMGVQGFLHTARKLHTIQHKTVAAQKEQQNLLLSLSQQYKALTQQHEGLTQQQQALLDSFANQQVSQVEFLAQQQKLAKEQQNLDQQQKALQTEFDALTQQQLAPQPELTAVDQSQAPQAELQTLAQHHLTPQAELDSLAQQQQDLQADLLPLVMQLQDLDTRGKDHLTLDVKKDLPLDQFLLSLQEKLLPRGVDVPLLTERKTKQTKLTADAEQLAALLVKGIASLQWLIKDQDQYLLLGLEDTQLSYPLPDVEEGYIKQVPALRFTLTMTEELPPLKASYKPDLTNFTPVAHQTFQAMEEEADKRLIKAHYGYTEVSEDTLIYVIPVDVYEVRPLDMDKPALAIGALPERSNDHFIHETADAQAQEEAFLKVVSARSDANLGMIKLALNLIKWYHGPKKRHTQEPFYLHPLAVAQIVMDYDQDEATIVGALLHDTVEDTPMLMGHIEALFGKDTAGVVDLVTHLQSIPGSMYKVKLSSEENLKMLGTTLNRRGLYVKLADRMHNMRTINGHPRVSKRKLVARETMDFFVPLAQKLGLTEAATEFEKMCSEVFKQKE